MGMLLVIGGHSLLTSQRVRYYDLHNPKQDSENNKVGLRFIDAPEKHPKPTHNSEFSSWGFLTKRHLDVHM